MITCLSNLTFDGVTEAAAASSKSKRNLVRERGATFCIDTAALSRSASEPASGNIAQACPDCRTGVNMLKLR
jgi:hypothetical protein